MSGLQRVNNRVDSFSNQDYKIKKLHKIVDDLLKDKNFDELTFSYPGNNINENVGQKTVHFNSDKKDHHNDYEKSKNIFDYPSKQDINKDASLESTIKLYKSIGDRNADFLFNWLYNIYSNIYLSSIDNTYKEPLTLTKTKLGIFDVLIDDLADNSKMRDKQLLEECMKIPWENSQIYYDNQYFLVAKQIWLECINSIQEFPRYNDFKDIFYFDIQQFMNCNRYSFLINTKNSSNFIEDKAYLHHGVMVLTHCDLDLMCSPDFDYNELEKLRPILYTVQDFFHIGNMLNTYPREIGESDLSSPIISLALRKGLIQKNTLKDDPEYTLESLKPLVPIFEKRMKDDLSTINRHLKEIRSIDMEKFYNQLKKVGNEFLTRKPYWKNYNKEVEEKPLKFF